jgi:hypothetical protein
MENLEALYNQVSKEATALKSELNSNILAYGGYPEIAYSSIDAETALLQKQLDAEMQTYMSLYDDLFAYYKRSRNSCHYGCIFGSSICARNIRAKR